MPAGEYPFIEIAVHPAVREKFAAGQGLAVFSVDSDYVYWANGSAARQFGYASIYAFLEDDGFADAVLARQIATAATRLGPERESQNLILRIGSGFRRMATPCTLELIRLSDGVPALLLALPVEHRLKDSVAVAASMIEGFGEAGAENAGDGETHVAVLDGDGNPLAHSATFGLLEIAHADLETMMEGAIRDPFHLVKRSLPTARGVLPAAIGHMAEGVNLVFVVEPENATPMARISEAEPAGNTLPDPVAPAEAPAPTARPVPAAHDPQAPRPAVPPSPPAFAFDPSGRPVRFVWKIDTGGRFSEISPEFADAVGPHAADVIGRTFAELAKVFNLDPDGVIEALLHRRDTWSGKTVRWPVQGTDLSVPVDLAALPTYTRDRTFDGFRGFGIVRISDAAPDPERLGLALEPTLAPPADGTPQATGTPKTETSHDDPPAAPVSTDFEASGRLVSANDPGKPDRFEAGTGGAERDDPFRGEVPALRIVETPARRDTDKVIDLERHRSRGREGLSAMDQAVFRQIGEELGRRLATPEARDAGAPARRDESDVPDHSEPQAAADHASDRPATPAGVVEPATVAPALSSTAAEPVDAVQLLRPAVIRDAEHVRAVALSRSPFPMPATPDVFVRPAEHVSTVVLERRIIADGMVGHSHDADADAPLDDGAETSVPGPGMATSTGLPFMAEARAASPGRAVLTRALVDNLPLPILIHRGDALLHANPAFLTLTGHADLRELDAAGGLGTLIEIEDTPALARERGDSERGRLTLRRFDGQEISAGAHLQSVGWGEGHALMLALDVQAPQATALATPNDGGLTSAEIEVDELRSILETATDGVVILGDDGAIRSMNRSASALFDYDREETTGKPFAMLFAHESQRSVLDYIASLAQNGVASVLNDGREVIGREASGGFIPLFMTIGHLRGSGGYCAVIRDITHWKRTEEELRNAKRAADTANAHKSDFLARVSHEIRTPLNAIIGFAEMMATERFGPLGSARYLEYAHDIGRSGRHVLDIVNDLLDISKIEAGEQTMEFVAVALNETLAESVSILQPQANAQRVIIRTSLSTSLPDVVADQRSIKQIAINLLANAIRFTPSGGQIVVSTAYDPTGRVVIRVRDTGIGMSRSELDQAMKPFRQGATSPMRPRGDGTGLGLPLTKAMVEANRAQFSIESAPGEGTLVQIAFPPQRVLAE
jgi:PAS domain S-box-containing protein